MHMVVQPNYDTKKIVLLFFKKNEDMGAREVYDIAELDPEVDPTAKLAFYMDKYAVDMWHGRDSRTNALLIEWHGGTIKNLLVAAQFTAIAAASVLGFGEDDEGMVAYGGPHDPLTVYDNSALRHQGDWSVYFNQLYG